MQNSTTNSKKRKAGSDEFTNKLLKAKDPFGARNREKPQSGYDAFKERGYDDLNNLETYKAQHQNNRLKKGGNYDINDAARASMKEGGFDFSSDLSNYDHGASGNKNFDMRDVKYLKKSGASDEAITKYIGGLDKVGEGVRNNSTYGGTHYRGDMDKTKGIEQYDMGKGFNNADIKYLQAQGYDDKAITDYGLSTGKNFGAATAKFLDGQGRLDSRAKNTFDNRMGPATQNPVEQNPHTAPADISEQYKRVDKEMNKDNWSKQVKQEADLRANDTDSWDSQEFLGKHLNMAREAASTRTGLDLSQYKTGFNLDIGALDKHIRQGPLYHEAKSELAGLQTYGDKYRNSRENQIKWNSPTAPAPFKPPNFGDIYDRTKKDIDGI